MVSPYRQDISLLFTSTELSCINTIYKYALPYILELFFHVVTELPRTAVLAADTMTLRSQGKYPTE
jgi:hypothetical protein